MTKENKNLGKPEAQAGNTREGQMEVDRQTRYMRDSPPEVMAAFKKWSESVDALGYNEDYHFGASHGFEAGVKWARGAMTHEKRDNSGALDAGVSYPNPSASQQRLLEQLIAELREIPLPHTKDCNHASLDDDRQPCSCGMTQLALQLHRILDDFSSNPDQQVPRSCTCGHSTDHHSSETPHRCLIEGCHCKWFYPEPKDRSTPERELHIWHCGCGTVNGVNLSTCGVCNRPRGEGEISGKEEAKEPDTHSLTKDLEEKARYIWKRLNHVIGMPVNARLTAISVIREVLEETEPKDRSTVKQPSWRWVHTNGDIRWERDGQIGDIIARVPREDETANRLCAAFNIFASGKEEAQSETTADSGEPGAVRANTVLAPQMELLGVVKAAYLKHHCGLDNVGWEALSDMMCNALCNAMGDTEFQRWLEENTR